MSDLNIADSALVLVLQMYLNPCLILYVHVIINNLFIFQKLQISMGFLVGDCLVAAAFLSYSGPFLSNYRDELVQQTWLKQVMILRIRIHHSNQCSCHSTLT